MTNSSDLLSLLRSPITMDRTKAALRSRDRPDLADALINLLSDEYYECRAQAALSLGSIGHTSSISRLIELLRDEVEEVRFSVAEALGNFENSEVADALLDTLSDYSRETQRQAMNSLIKFDQHLLKKKLEDRLTELVDEDYDMLTEASIWRIDVVRGIMELCELIQYPWIDGILKFGIGNPDSEMNRLAAIAIGKQQLHDFAPYLLQLQHEEHDDVRLGVLYALSQVNFPDKYETMKIHFDDTYEFIREHFAASLLIIFPELDHIQQMGLYAKDFEPLVRKAAAGNMGEERYISILTQLLADEVFYVRQAAIQSLAGIGSGKSLDILTNHEEEDELAQVSLNNAIAVLVEKLTLN